MADEYWMEKRSKLSGSVLESAFKHFDPDTDAEPDPDGSWLLIKT